MSGDPQVLRPQPSLVSAQEFAITRRA